MQQRPKSGKSLYRRFWPLRMAASLAICFALSAAMIAALHPSTTASTLPPWPPFVRIVPQGNGDDVTVYAEGIGHAYSLLSATFGGTSHTWSHADLDYDPYQDLYRGVATAALSEPCFEPAGCLRVTTAGTGDPNLETLLAYEFGAAGPAYAPNLALESAQLRFATPPFTDTITHTVVLAIPSRAPAPLPGGWWILEGGLYLVESDAIDGSLRAVLSMQYDPDWLDWHGIRPEDLRIWRWNAAEQNWVAQPSTLTPHLFRVHASISALTAYALAAPPKPPRSWLPIVTRN